MGDSFFVLGRYAEAVDAYRQAVTLDPEDVWLPGRASKQPGRGLNSAERLIFKALHNSMEFSLDNPSQPDGFLHWPRG